MLNLPKGPTASGSGNVNINLNCPQFLRHQGCVIAEQGLALTASAWAKRGYRCFKFVQQKGDMIITYPGVYHSGINVGYNLNEAINFGTKQWVKEGMRYKGCNCLGIENKVVLDMLEIETVLKQKQTQEA
jgi:jumonji domain-containing protein 2